MAFIMRYCFEEKINLREREFLKDLSSYDPLKMDESRIKSHMQRPLNSDSGLVRSVEGDLVIYSFPEVWRPKDGVSFNSEDVPEFVEGMMRVLDCDSVFKAHKKCANIVNKYHEWLDAGLLK